MVRLDHTAGLERRRHARIPVCKPVKVRPAGALTYAAGATVNASSSGVLIETPASGRFAPGDEVEVVVAWDDEPVLPRASSIVARVRRINANTDRPGGRLALELIGASLSSRIAPSASASTQGLHAA